MIVDPDFLDHWRTGMVADAINDPMAAIYILRLWAHCQERKSDTFDIPTAGLKAQCKCPADAATFEKALIDAGFIARDGATIKVLGWAEKNASLIAAWENGSKGGRPKKNPAETHGKPMGNPAVTHGQPIANPDETDKSREEKSNTSSLRSEVCAKPRASKRCPDDFQVTTELREWAEAECPGVDLMRETASFRDYTFAKAYSDWPATWRNWIRRSFGHTAQARASPRKPSKHTRFEQMDYTAGVNADGTLA